MPSKRTKEQYIEEAKKIHNNKFDYTLIKELPKRDKSKYYLSITW
jgi:hypothetical protein